MKHQCETPKRKPAIGSLEWGRRHGRHAKGRLTRMEKIAVTANLGRMASLQFFDVLADKAGLIRTYGSTLDGLLPAETTLVQDSLAFAEEVQGLEIMRHSWRTYYFGMLLGAYSGYEVDREILFCSAILHDVGLAAGREEEPCACCFTVQGAERTFKHLIGKGQDRAKVRQIADAIGLHLNGYVSARRHGAEAHLLSRGAMCDVFNMGKKRLTPRILKEISALYPKQDLADALEVWPGHHLEGSRADLFIKLTHNKQGRGASKPDALLHG
ncbi:HD domain-containing protein [Roseibium denhamense]|uniref:HD domain-containing protein n=2 Tax=Roseibium denhamense TaxID=76305 RepID=A0ABY1NQI2_9HYPH|nr:HD domain-containing protein [Roseibium denhamense]